jgi:hypothetical protein
MATTSNFNLIGILIPNANLIQINWIKRWKGNFMFVINVKIAKIKKGNKKHGDQSSD